MWWVLSVEYDKIMFRRLIKWENVHGNENANKNTDNKISLLYNLNFKCYNYNMCIYSNSVCC